MASFLGIKRLDMPVTAFAIRTLPRNTVQRVLLAHGTRRRQRLEGSLQGWRGGTLQVADGSRRSRGVDKEEVSTEIDCLKMTYDI